MYKTLSHSCYLADIFHPMRLRSTVQHIHNKLQELKSSGISFDAIAFTGNSGAGIAYPLSARYGYNLICIRKGESSHGNRVEASKVEVSSYIIVDDQISTGATVMRIIGELSQMKCMGIILYDCPYHEYFIYEDSYPELHIPVYYLPRSQRSTKKGNQL